MGNRESEQEPLTASAAAEANMCCIIFSVTVACATVVGFTCRQHSERNRACRSSPVVADLAGLGSGCRANLEGFESGHSGTNRGDNPSLSLTYPRRRCGESLLFVQVVLRGCESFIAFSGLEVYMSDQDHRELCVCMHTCVDMFIYFH